MSENVNSVRIGSALGWARVAYAKNVLSFVALSVVVMILQFGQQFAAGPFTETFSRCVEAGGTDDVLNSTAIANCFEADMGSLLLVLLMAFVFVVASFLATAGVIRGALYVTLGRKIGFADTFTGPYFGAFALTALLIMVTFVAGLFLFIVPAILVILLFQFAPFFALDRGLAPFQSLKASAGLVRRNWPLAILLLLFSAAAYLISGLFWGIPTVLFLPLAALVTAYAYRSIQGEMVDPFA
ncbi:MAG: hypothetical protein WAO33_05890 [Candidatus Nanopelagicales bacterium]|nr:hypothetical protein [Actinomycetes bacterium]